MTKSTKGPLFAEVHNVPDDYHFTEEELDRIIAGDMFTPRQGAIMARELQERRKAAMDSEPVAYIIQDRYEREGGVEGHLSRSHVSKYVSQEDINEHEIICTPLFKAPSLTHSIPDEWTFQNTQRYREDTGRQDAWPAMWGWNACRAAMLQAEPVTANKLGNSPVIPDGYVMVPKEPTAEMQSAGASAIRIETTAINKLWTGNAVFRAMLAAAPQDTPALNSLQNVATVSDTWIPVSERMPERGDCLVTDGCDFDVQLFNGEQFIPGFVWEDKITHWMPLPAGPQEVKGE
ncbi:DUF551 domain-containing protein [Klebsiella aerogenes]|uniref:DUF551 domain-containing protein n=1 Tax=Klebsiella aerogenes TaxID=548 RepID=UPI001E5D12C8|nr:DUF551 domain-containing protein [Klebsiella aerogenes]MCD0203296.1 DUF551 domain-containing protein [Klebsiella aerogenes]